MEETEIAERGGVRGADAVQPGPAPGMTRAQRHQLLVEWNDTRTAGDGDSTFLGLFAARVATLPDAVAVVDGDDHVTYRQLDRRSSRLAGTLGRRGAGPEVRVGLLLERTLAMVVAAVAIFKTRAVYVPLDPSYPEARIRAMIDDAAIACVVTREALRGRLPADGRLEVLGVDPVDETAGNLRPPPAAPSLGAAYLVYTSGSTGEPKGVVIADDALGWYCRAATGHYRIRPGDRLLQLAAIGFDISVGEIFPCLAAGATLVLHGGERAGADFLARCRELAITVLFPATALWHELADLAELDPEAVPRTLRLVSFGGERVLPRRLDAWRRAVGTRLRLVNGYGPTETAVEATVFEATAAGAGDAALIGRPVAGARVFVLDRKLRPVAPGAEGELAIAGRGLARGYLGRPGATAPRFVPDPLAGPGGRLYLSGDRVCWRPSGHLEIRGRFDHQIKIRGFRVEPGEIEAALTRHPAVRDAAVLGRRRGPHRSLVAWVVTRRPAPGARGESGSGILGVGAAPAPDGALQVPLASELRRFLARRLPAYMVPARFVAIEELPRMPSGKVDRRALLLAAPRAPRSPAAAATPRRRRRDSPPRGTPRAETLARIWAQVMRLDRVGPDDDFFDLGGDSILAIQIVIRAYRAGLRLSPNDVFEHPTPAGLAEAAARAAPGGRRGPRGPVAGAAPLTPVQCWFFHDAQLEEPWHFNQSMLLEVRRPLDLRVLEAAVGLLLRHHDALRGRFEPSGDVVRRQVFAPPGAGAPVTGLDLSRLVDGDAGSRLSAAAASLQASLDLVRGPLLRCAYFDFGSRRTPRLLIVVHHLVMDAVSWGILLDDLERACRRLGQSLPASLPPRSTSFSRWAKLQARHAASAELARQREFWAAQVGPAGPLPRDFADGANSARSVATVSVALDPRTTRRLLRQAPAAYRTRIDDVLLTALAGAMRPWCGPLTVDLESHGREEVFAGTDLSRTVGWFTSTFPVRLDLNGIGSEGEALMAVKETLRAIPESGIGYGMLRYLAPGGDALRSPAEVSFNYLGQLDALFATSELFAPAPEPRGREASRLGTRSYVLEVDGGVVDGRLWFHWRFSENLHRRSTIERLAAAFKNRLEALVAHCLSPGAGGVTPSDFPLARLDRRRLDRLVAGRDVEDAYPLSPMQQGMLFHSLYAPRSAVYFEQASWAISGDLDPGTLHRAWQLLAQRHPILRTAFAWRDLERPLQVVHRRVELPWRVVDWRCLEEVRQEAILDGLLRRDRRRRLDLEQPPLMRLTLVRLGTARYRLLWSFHHLLLDGWSIAALFDELFTTYEALRHGRRPRLPARRRPRDFIAWLEGRDLAAAETFWRRKLDGFTVPTLVARSGTPTDARGEVADLRKRLDAERTAALQSLARSLRTTLSNVVQGAWALLLGRLVGKTDVAFGATVSGRPAELPGADSILGLLINTVPVRLRLEPRRPLAAWLAQVQAESLERGRHEHAPLVDVQAWSEVPAQRPLFDSLLVFENYPTEAPLEAGQQRAGLRVDGFLGTSRTNYPLTLGVLPGAELVVEASVDPARFGILEASRLLWRFDVLLAGMVEDPARALEDLPVLSRAERHQVLREWNDSGAAPLGAPAVHRLFEARVERAPDAVALVAEAPEDQAVTYGALNRRANRLARALRRRGVRPESRVGVALDRPQDTVPAILAVLKAGGAYVPLDPAQPERRSRAMLAAAGIRLLLTRGQPARKLPSLDLERDAAEIARQRAGNLPASPGLEVRPANLAYVLHTSGSTGEPKGVMVTHGALLSALAGWRRAYALRAVARRHLQLAVFTFDVASGDLVRALGTGAALVLCPRDLAAAPRQLDGLIRRQRVDCAELVPAVAELLARHLESEGAALEGLRLLAVGSDAWRMGDLRRLARLTGGGTRLVNSYGVTEATIDSTFFDPRLGTLAASLDADRPVPIGRPFAATRAYVLDRRGEPAGGAAAGELALAGAGLARGYADRPAATAERFVPDAVGAATGGRLYRTGDLARHLPGGSLELLGRIDHQVKIRGVRVEPGEVEAALRRHPALRDAVVGVRPGAAGERALAAYLVAAPGAGAPEPGALRRFLAERLPPPMVPSLFVALDALPLNRHGKVDRGALARIEPAPRIAPGPPTEAPATPTERALADLWARILGVNGVGRHDDFFDLGGHSLRAVRLTVEIERRFGVRLSLASLFLEPELAEVARRIDRLGAGARMEQPAARAG